MKKRTTHLKAILLSTLMLTSIGLMAQIEIVSTECICTPAGEGSITISVSGTAGPFTFEWESPSGYSSEVQNPDDITMPGDYTVVVTNAYGCETVLSTEVVQCNPDDPLDIEISSTSACFDDDSSGSASVEASGGESPYTYLWDDENESTDSEVSDLPPGEYCVTVTDAQGCEVEDCVEVEELSAINIEFEVEASCSGQNTGSIEAMVSGGVEPYTYMWSDLSNQSSMQNVASGTHWVLVHDATGCQTYAVVDVPVMESPTVTPMVSYASCEDNEDGAIELEISGGTAPYEVFWENSDYNGMTEINNLAAGDYEVTVTGSNGCSNVEVISTAAPAPHVMMPFIERVTVNATNGNQTIPIYNGYWDETGGGVFCYNGGMEDISGSDLELIQNGGWALEVTAFIQGELSGSVYLIVEGYVLQTSYINLNSVTWEVEDIYTQQVAENNFNVNLIFEHNDLLDLFRESNQLNGCVQIPLLQEDCSWLPAYTQGQDTHPLQRECATITFDVQYEPEEVVSVEVSGDASDYTFDWAGPEGFTAIGQRRIRPEAGGEYCLTITSQSNDCVVEECVEVCSDFDDIIEEEDYVQYILPCYAQSNGSICIPSEIKGYQVTIDWDRSGNEYCLENISANDWCATITEQTCGRSVYHCFRLDELPKGLEAEVTSTVPPCRGMSDGQLCIAVTEGLPPYTYQWENGQSGNCINFVEAGTYCVTIVDDCGSVGEQCFTLEHVTSMNLTDLDVIPTCEDVSEGSVSFSILGGQPPYDITMIDRTSGEEVNSGSDDVGTYLHLGEGFYIIEIEDDCGEEISKMIYVPEISEEEGGIQAFFLENTNPSDCGDNDGIIRIRALTDSDFHPMQYTLSAEGVILENGISNEFITLNNIEYGTYYSIILTNAAGCSTKLAYQHGTIKDAADYFKPIDSYSCNEEGGSIENLLSEDEQADWNYTWSNGSNASQLSELEAGTYCVTMTSTDNNACLTGCWEIEDVEVFSPSLGSYDIEHILSYPQAPTGSFIVSGRIDVELEPQNYNGQLIENTFLWSDGSTSEDITVTSEGEYSLIVTNQFGCESVYVFEVDKCVRFYPPAYVLVNHVTESGLGELELINTAYDFYWTGPSGFFSGLEIISNLGAGIYSLHLSDDCGYYERIDYQINNCQDYYLFYEVIDPCSNFNLVRTQVDIFIGKLDDTSPDLSGHVYLYNGGDLVRNSAFENGGMSVSFWLIGNLSGNFRVQVNLENGCTYEKHFSLLQTPHLAQGYVASHLGRDIDPGIEESFYIIAQQGYIPYLPSWSRVAIDRIFWNCEYCLSSGESGNTRPIEHYDCLYGVDYAHLTYEPIDYSDPCRNGGYLIGGSLYREFVPPNEISVAFMQGNQCACFFPAGVVNIGTPSEQSGTRPVYAEFPCSPPNNDEVEAEITLPNECDGLNCETCIMTVGESPCIWNVSCGIGDEITIVEIEGTLGSCIGGGEFTETGEEICHVYLICEESCDVDYEIGVIDQWPCDGNNDGELDHDVPYCCDMAFQPEDEPDRRLAGVDSLYNNKVYVNSERFYSKAYPNPVTDKVKLFIRHENELNINVSIFNLTGNRFFNDMVSINQSDNIFELNVASLNPGIYFLTLGLEDGQIVTHKFVKE